MLNPRGGREEIYLPFFMFIQISFFQTRLFSIFTSLNLVLVKVAVRMKQTMMLLMLVEKKKASEENKAFNKVFLLPYLC